jgi:surfeit locus 1 family protein
VSGDTQREDGARGRFGLAAMIAVLALAFAGFVALGIWQVQRLHWKHALIARVESRIHADAVPVPARDAWPRFDAESGEYRRVFSDGRYLPGRDARVQALTELGPGFWILTPLRTGDGIVLVNRGFVPDDALDRIAPPPAGEVRVRGLLRISEPHGRFLRRNRPGEDRWYSRDVAAIAQRRGLREVAPFFIDADAGPVAAGERWPRGGMTVVKFRDQHLQYALTWFGLALLTAFAAWRLLTQERRLRHHAGDADSPARPRD